LAKLLGKKYTVDDADYFWSSKKITEFKKKILKLGFNVLSHFKQTGNYHYRLKKKKIPID
jgi:hypothetical protein